MSWFRPPLLLPLMPFTRTLKRGTIMSSERLTDAQARSRRGSTRLAMVSVLAAAGALAILIHYESRKPDAPPTQAVPPTTQAARPGHILVSVPSGDVTAASSPSLPTEEAQLPPPEQAVVMAWPLRWWSSHWGGSLDTKSVAMEMRDGHPVFKVNEPDRRHVWGKYFDVPIPFPQYAIMKITCRATGLATADGYVVWLDDSAGPDYGGLRPVRQNDLLADGRIEYLEIDLRALPGQRQDLRGIAIGVQSGHGAAELELLDVRFTTPTDGPILPAPTLDPPAVVKVVDAEGQPIADAEVGVDAERANWAKQVRTNAQGEALVMPLRTHNGKHMLRITPPAQSGHVAVDVREVKLGDPLTVTLPKAVMWRGLVNDESGKPLAGATVRIDVPREGNLPVWPCFDAEVLTNADGTWQAPPLPRSDQPTMVRVAHPDYSPGAAYNVEHQLSADAAESPQTLAMAPVVDVHGIVVAADGKPVAGVDVVVGRKRWFELPGTKTAGDGGFTLRIRADQAARLTVLPTGHAPQTLDLENPASAQDVRIELPPASVLIGQVVDEEGKPVAGAAVSAHSWRDSRAINFRTSTDGQGRFRWPSAPADEVIIGVSKTGYGSPGRLPLKAGEQPHIITLPPPDAKTRPYDSNAIFRKLSRADAAEDRGVKS